MKKRCTKCNYSEGTYCAVGRPEFMTVDSFKCEEYERKNSETVVQMPHRNKPKVRVVQNDEICFIIHGD